MKYDFDTLTLRRGTNSYKWDEAEDDDVIPLWVADMDFQTAPCIVEALKERVAHGIFGYTMVPDSYYKATTDWFARRHGWQIERRHMMYTSGVVPALSATIKALTSPGDKVLVQTPVYNCFFSSIRNNGCTIEESQLKRTDDSYVVDFDDFEQKCSDPDVKVFVMCNPHNPAGRVWTADEIRQMRDICYRHDVTVVADEIHCELVMPGYRYTPCATVCPEQNDRLVVLNSPSKSFNIAGLQIANIITENDSLLKKIDRAVNINEVCDVNPFGVIALQAAYNEGEEWLCQLNDYLYHNYLLLKAFFETHLPQIKILRLEGTYLVWADITALHIGSDNLTQRLLDEAKVWLNSGTMYGKTAGEGYLRINIACPRQRLEEALCHIGKVLC